MHEKWPPAFKFSMNEKIIYRNWKKGFGYNGVHLHITLPLLSFLTCQREFNIIWGTEGGREGEREEEKLPN